MQIQRVLKGVCGLDAAAASLALREAGIVSNWWRDAREITPAEVVEQLTEERLERHLNQYDEVDAATGRVFGEVTPFISTTAGTVIRDARGRRNLIYDADFTATWFATDGFRLAGWVFSGYLFTLGRKAIPHQAFAEELRELNIYTAFLPYQPEGELVAKVHIPPVQLEEAWALEPIFDPADPGRTRWPRQVNRLDNPDVFLPPEEIVNLRGLL